MADETATPTIEELQVEVRNLKVQLAANETRGEKAIVNTVTETGEHKKVTVAQLREEVAEITQGFLLASARAKRDREESERRQPVPYVTDDHQLQYRTPTYQNDALLTKDAAIKLHGLAGWERLSNAQKVQAIDIRESDLRAYKMEDIFGSKSSASKAVLLQRTNPTAYKLLKQRAIADGTFNS